MIGQLSQMLMGVVDTVMVGHLGVKDLAALTFANSLFHVPFVFGIGLLTGVSVFTANSRGAEDAAGARESCRHGLYLALAIGAAVFALAWWVSLHLEIFHQPPDITERSVVFFRVIMASALPALASVALKNHADALGHPWPPFWIFLGGVLLNVGLNLLLIEGRWGCPALGIDGAAWATLISRFAILAAMLWSMRSKGLAEWVPRHWLRRPHFRELGRLLSVGLPASIQMVCEVSAFSLAGLAMGKFGETAMAAHQVAMTLAATAFMVPLGLSMALTVQIGKAHGAREMQRLRPIALSGWLLGAGASIVAAAAFIAGGEFLASLFTNAEEVVTLAGHLLIIVGIFQLVDSLQVASAAMLRGLQDSRVPAIMGFVSYWLVGLPVGAGLAFYFKMGAAGVWWGLAAGLFFASVTLGPRLWRRIQQAGG